MVGLGDGDGKGTELGEYLAPVSALTCYKQPGPQFSQCKYEEGR